MIRQRSYRQLAPQQARPAPAARRHEHEEQGVVRWRLTLNHAVAGVIWLAGCGATWHVIAALGGRTGWWSLSLAFMVQGVLTALERPLWRWREAGHRGTTAPPSSGDYDVAIGALLLDVLFNAGGVWVWVRKLDQTPLWVMLQESLGLRGGMGGLPALVLSLLIGYLVAKAPERVWKW